MRETVDFYGVMREVEITPYLLVGTTVYGVARIDGTIYTLTKRQDETIWHVQRRWT